MWMNCQAIKTLLSVATNCFAQLTAVEVEAAITVLLNTFVKHAPHFDWVVARLGHCFSHTVITRIVHFGLDNYAANQSNALESEIGILSELCLANDQSLAMALKRMIGDLLQEQGQPNRHTIPYLIHLSRSSHVLLQPIVRVLLELFEDGQVVPNAQKLAQSVETVAGPELYNLLTVLAMRVVENGTKILLLLARNGQTTPFCGELLEHILLDLEDWMLDDRHLTGERPLLIDLLKDCNKALLWQSCISECALEQQTAVRLIMIVAPRTPYILHQTVAELMTVPDVGRGALVQFLGGVNGSNVEHLNPDQGLEMTLDLMLLANNSKEMRTLPNNNDNDSNDALSEPVVILTNLLALLEIEGKSMQNVHLKRCPVTKFLSRRHGIGTLLKLLDQCFRKLDPYFNAPAVTASDSTNKKLKRDETKTQLEADHIERQIHLIIAILNLIEIRITSLNMSEALKFARLTVRAFFWMLTESDAAMRERGLSLIKAILTKVCQGRKGIKIAALKELIESAVFVHRDLFGGPAFAQTTVLGPAIESMMRLNQEQDAISGTNRTALHAGLIGQGLKRAERPVAEPSAELLNHYVDAVSACCLDSERAHVTDGFSTVSLLLVDIVSPDVMYNGLPWPEEDFTKVTMERDLQIRRMFKHSPVLWSLLSLVAAHRPALCFSSVLLRALCATVLHQWRARSVERPFTGTVTTKKHMELMQVTQRMLQIMTLGQLLPPPLDNLHVLVDKLDPTEVALVLRDCVWNYMREVVPSPVLFECAANGLVWRNPASARPASQYTDTLRRIMLKKLPALGALYNQMFVMEQSKVIE